MAAALDVVPLARPHRPVLVAGTLGELTGPTRGLVELPLRLWWGPQRAFDLDDPTMLTWMYENVLRESIRVGELRAYVDGATLIRVWQQLNLPRAVRAAWEARHPRLRLAPAKRSEHAGPVRGRGQRGDRQAAGRPADPALPTPLR